MRQYIYRAARAAAVAGVALIAGVARADFTLTLTPNPASGAQGATVSILARLENTGTSDVAILGLNGNIVPGGVTWDDDDFIAALPEFLAPDEIYQNNLFLVISSGAAPGLFSATYGVDGDEGGVGATAEDTVALTVTGGVAAAPEPGTLPLMAPLGVAALGLVVRARRVRGAH